MPNAADRAIHHTAIALLAFSAVAGCSPERGAQPSSGVPVWTVSEPITQIGGIDGPAETLFQGSVTPQLIGDSILVVVDAGPPSLRVFRTDGTFVREIGRPGEGPGEYQSMVGVGILDPDTLVVVDLRTMRLTQVGLDGDVYSTERLIYEEGRFDRVIGFFSDNSFLEAWTPYGEDYNGLRTTLIIYGRFSIDGQYLGEVASRRDIIGVFDIPFSTYGRATIITDTIFYTNGERPELEVISREGQSARTIELPLPQVQPDIAKRRLDSVLAAAGSDRRGELASTEVDAIPYIGGMLRDDLGLIWVKKYDPATESSWLRSWVVSKGGEWIVVDLEGNLVATVELPDGFKVTHIGESLITGVYLDEYDVQQVAVHRLSRGS